MRLPIQAAGSTRHASLQRTNAGAIQASANCQSTCHQSCAPNLWLGYGYSAYRGCFIGCYNACTGAHEFGPYQTLTARQPFDN